jgi:cytoplasmic iron level regulating protein YaaA (DUF328/UPF0246 family)
MIILLSPAKTLDFETPPHTRKHSKAVFLKQASELVDQLSGYSPKKLSSLMGISDKLAKENSERYQNWKTPFSLNNAKQSVLAFKGDVYTGLDAGSLKSADLDFAQKHLRILSGLYGLLHPLDLIQPYRLEMGTSLKTDHGNDLYAFWGEQITRQLNKELKTEKSGTVINLASNEYFKSVKQDLLNATVVTPVFKDEKNGKYKIISFYAKKARGMMAAYIIKNRIRKVEDLKKFKTSGYRFSASESSDTELVFKRKELS